MFSLDYRPKSYWTTSNIKIKGELRRQAAKNLATEGIHDLMISAENLSEEELTAVGRVHPHATIRTKRFWGPAYSV